MGARKLPAANHWLVLTAEPGSVTAPSGKPLQQLQARRSFIKIPACKGRACRQSRWRQRPAAAVFSSRSRKRKCWRGLGRRGWRAGEGTPLDLIAGIQVICLIVKEMCVWTQKMLWILSFLPSQARKKAGSKAKTLLIS